MKLIVQPDAFLYDVPEFVLVDGDGDLGVCGFAVYTEVVAEGAPVAFLTAEFDFGKHFFVFDAGWVYQPGDAGRIVQRSAGKAKDAQ